MAQDEDRDGPDGGWGGRPGAAREASTERITRAAVVQLGGRAFNILLGVAAVGLLARAIGPEGFGVWSTALAYVGIFGVFADLGLAQIATLRMSEEPEREDEWLGALMGTVALASVGALLITIAAVPLLSDQGDVRLVTAILALTLLGQAPGTLLAVFDSRVRAGLRMGLLTLNSLFWLAAIIILDLSGAGLVAFAVAFVATSAASAFAQVTLVRRFARVALRRGRELWRPLVRVALPVGLSGVLITIYYRIDSVLLFNLRGAEEAGIYGAAYRFLDPLHFLPVSVMAATVPVMAALRESDPARMRRLIQRGGEYLVIAALGALAVTIPLSPTIVDLVLGDGYERTAGVLPVLMLAFVFISLGYLSGYLVPMVNKQWRLVGYAAFGAVANVGLNLLLIPSYGALGAAWATVVTEAAVNGLALVTVFVALRFKPKLGRLVRALFAAAATTAAIALAQNLGGIFALIVAGPAYLLALAACRAITVSEIRELLASRRSPSAAVADGPTPTEPPA